jgi:hypothetical protein
MSTRQRKTAKRWKTRVIAGLSLAMGIASGSSLAFAQNAPTAPSGPDTSIAQKAPPAPDWRWRQITASLRTQGRFAVVEVDPSNPQLILIGTEEGTIMRSDDGGVTWQEIEAGPSVVQKYSFAPKEPGLPQLGEIVPPDYAIFVDPPFSNYLDRVFVRLETAFFSIRPEFVGAGFMPKITMPAPEFLGDATRQRDRLNTVWSIAYCEGSPYRIIVATNNDVFGSADDGMTYVRLFAIPGRVPIYWARCNPNNPLEVAVASEFGAFLSKDGGLTFDQELTGWPGRPATAVEWAASKHPKLEKLYIANGDVIFAGDPDSDEGLRMIYPDFNNAATAPWGTVYDIKTTPSGEVWAGTEDGLRASFDGGETWHNVDQTLLGRARIRRLAVGWNEWGGERVVAVLGNVRPNITGSTSNTKVSGPLANIYINPHPPRDWVYSTDDSGKTWHPFYNDLTRRTIMAASSVPAQGGKPAHWWVVSRGELWGTAFTSDTLSAAIDENTAQWAKAKLAATPPLDVVIQAMLDANYISAEELAKTFHRAKNIRPYIPRLDLSLSLFKTDYSLAEQQVITSPYFRNATSDRVEWLLLMELKFLMRLGGIFIEEESGTNRLALYDLNKQVRYVAEDTWHERHTLLGRLADGMSDELEIEVMRARIESLEAILETWTRQPLRNLLTYQPWN